MTTTINADNGVSSGSAGLKESADSSGVLQLQTNGTAALTIDTSQNVGIGSSQLNNAFLTVSKSVNGDVGLSVLNTNTGASANVRIDIGNANYNNSQLTITAYSDTAAGTLLGVTAAKLKAVFDNSSTANTNGLLIGTAGANPLYFATNNAEKMRIDSSGNVLVTNVAGLGYGTGSGGTVTQATSKSTAVTLNKPTGQITMNNAALAAGARVGFNFNNSIVTGNDTVIVNTNSFGSYNVSAVIGGAGLVYIYLTNVSAGSLSDAVVLNYSVIKGATA